jgi:hypothetical protein
MVGRCLEFCEVMRRPAVGLLPRGDACTVPRHASGLGICLSELQMIQRLLISCPSVMVLHVGQGDERAVRRICCTVGRRVDFSFEHFFLISGKTKSKRKKVRCFLDKTKKNGVLMSASRKISGDSALKHEGLSTRSDVFSEKRCDSALQIRSCL